MPENPLQKKEKAKTEREWDREGEDDDVVFVPFLKTQYKKNNKGAS